MLKQDHTKYRGYRTAGIRLTEEILPNLGGHHRSETISQTLYGVHMFDKAHLVMLTEEGLIQRDAGVAMLKALREMEAEGIVEARQKAQGGIHSGEHYLIRRLGEEVGGQIHLGRSSGDLLQVSHRIAQRDRLLDLLKRINELRGVLIETAEKHVDTVMPGYTHGQHAQPTTYGHWLLSFACVFERDFRRLLAAYQGMNESPAGAAIMTGSEFPLNRHRTAELLGFEGLRRNTLDAVHSHDVLLEAHMAVANLHANLIRFAEDVQLWVGNDFNFLDIPDRFCGTSSIMMQKKNPYCFEEIKGAGAEALGAVATAFVVEKDPTATPIHDRRYSYLALYRSMETAERGLGWLVDLVPHCEPRKEHLEERAGDWWAQAADVAGALVREKGINWRSAHQIVGILVRFSYERGIHPRDVTPELLDEAAVAYFGKPVNLNEEVLRDNLDPRKCVEARMLYGGPGPEEVRRRLPEYQEALGRDRRAADAVTEALSEAARKMEAAIDGIIR